jgi:hypothetical protein
MKKKIIIHCNNNNWKNKKEEIIIIKNSEDWSNWGRKHKQKALVSFGKELQKNRIFYISYIRDARTISINIKTYIFLVYQLELTKTDIISPHL